jgi:hypothetical protein
MQWRVRAGLGRVTNQVWQLLQPLLTGLVLVGLALLSSACGAPAQSVAQFGLATDGLGRGVAETARGSATLCEHKRDLDLDEQVLFATATVQTVALRLTQDECGRFRASGRLYGKLAEQLSAFGLAMRTLALSGDTDYTDQLTEIGGNATSFGLSESQQPKVDAAAALSAKILKWFTQGYAKKQITAALQESEHDVGATLDLLLVVHEGYDVQLAGYSQRITQLSTEPEFDQPIEGGAPDAFDERKERQTALVKLHSAHAAERAKLLAASRAAINSVKTLHVALVTEAKREQDYDIESLVSKASKLATEVSDFRKLAAATIN